MAANLAVVAWKTSSTLYAVEDHLNCLMECEDTVTPEQEEEFVRDLAVALNAAVEKRDKLGQFMAHMEQQVAFAKQEIDRLTARKKMFERAIEKAEGYVVRVIESLGTDAKGKPKKLEGQTVTFSLRNCPASVAVANEVTIPIAYKHIAVKLPVPLYERIVDALDIETAAETMDAGGTISVDKVALKHALQAGEEIPGAVLVTDKKALVRK